MRRYGTSLCNINNLILSCPPAGPTTADESLFSMVLPSGNFVFTFVLGAPHLCGASRRMAASNRNRLLPISAIFVPKSGRPDFGCRASILRDGRPRGRPPQDEVRIVGRSTPLPAGGERR